MMLVPDKNPPTLKTRRSTGEPYYTPVGFRASPERWQPNNYIAKAESNSPKRHSAWWLIWIAVSWIGLLGFLFYVFV